ncbi:MAG: hypothetical protein GX119_03605 [Syntrophomonadaceae bacterium]|jgi:hypothetical protein|nr:hypothetical protein [Syntrophomonadaceae bacterium]
MNSKDILIETALVGQGMADLTDAELSRRWKAYFPETPDNIGFVWLWQGQKIIGDLDSFLVYRSRRLPRIDSHKLREGNDSSISGYCTASAALALSQEIQARVVVTAGMGGIFEGLVSSDLPEIARRQAVLIASGFKDMIEAKDSLSYLHARNILVSGISKAIYNGFLFTGDDILLDRQYAGESLEKLAEDNCYLVFNDIKNGLRLKDANWLKDSIEAGKLARNSGDEFHPAVNKALAYYSDGQSSRLQFEALMKNISLALKLADGK